MPARMATLEARPEAEAVKHTRGETRAPGSMSPWLERAFLGFVTACAAYMLYFSTRRLLSFDELLSSYTESLPTSKALLQVQAATPVSLDPPFYHLLGHWALDLGLNPAMAVRLPSLLGSFVMLAAVYLFARRLSGSFVAAIAVCGLVIANNFHMIEARPYGVLLGATGLALLCWQNAIRGRHRTASLLGLFLALGLATSSHYFGIVVAVPFLLVECLRTVERRKLDLPLAAALLGSYGFGLAWLPFLKGAHQYKTNYYIKVRLVDLFHAYTAPFDTALRIHAPAADALLALVIVALTAAGAYAGYRASRPSLIRRDEWALVFLLGLLPVAGVALATAASGAFETRYVVEFGIGLAIAISSGLVLLIPSRLAKTALLLGLSLVIVERFTSLAKENGRQWSRLTGVAAQLHRGPVTVITDREDYLHLLYYHRPLGVQQDSIEWVADMDREIASSGTDNIDRTMLNLHRFAGLPVVTYTDLLQTQHSFPLIRSNATIPPNWLVGQLQKDGAQFTTEATLGDLSVEQVTMPRQ